MPGTFYHYTSRAAAQDIMALGEIRPGRGGRTYVTDRRYASGAEAAQRLAIIGKVVEVVCIIPAERIHEATPEEGRHVERILLREVIARPGCGTEWYTDYPIDVSACEWSDLQTP